MVQDLLQVEYRHVPIHLEGLCRQMNMAPVGTQVVPFHDERREIMYMIFAVEHVLKILEN